MKELFYKRIFSLNRFKIFLTLLGLLFHLVGFSQAGLRSLNLTPTIQSPQAASLGKYIDFPVSLYTGQANISIPLYELKSGDISLPISLNYHTGGVRVEEIAPNVGLGWSLNVGGIVTRTVNGSADMLKVFEYKHPPYNMEYSDLKRLHHSASGIFDSEHDIFHFDFNGYSGKFVLDFENNCQPILIPKQDLKIFIKNNCGIGINEIKITTPEGLIYTFGKAEFNNRTIVDCTNSVSTIARRENSWFLTKIESPSTTHFVELEYETYRLNYKTKGVETKYHSFGGGSKPDEKCSVTNEIDALRLLKVTSSVGTSV